MSIALRFRVLLLLLSLPLIQTEGQLLSYIKNNTNAKVIMITTFPPKRCGIAQFSAHLYEGLSKLLHIKVMALSNRDDNKLVYPPSVVYKIEMDTSLPSHSFYRAANYIKCNAYTHVIIQQEFGLTPIQWQLLDLARWLAPSSKIITVVHTPTAYPNIEERELLRQMGIMSSKMIFMSWYGKYSAIHAYGIHPEKCIFIPHGIQSPLNDRALANIKHGSNILTMLNSLQSRLVIFTNGLIHPHKGYNRLIRILPYLVSIFPNLIFVIVGIEHGANREKNIMQKILSDARVLNVDKNIIWLNEYISSEQLNQFMGVADVYVTLYDEVTPTSGALLSAMAYGLAIVSTPFRFACEMLADDRGIFVPFNDKHYTALQFKKILSSKNLRIKLGKAAKNLVANWSWANIATCYTNIINQDRSCRIGDFFSNPFEKEKILSTDPSAIWSSKLIRSFDGRIIFNSSFLQGYSAKINSGIYSLYVDHDIQVNAFIESETLSLKTIGISSEFGRLIYDWNGNIDTIIEDKSRFDLYNRNHSIELTTKNTRIKCSYNLLFGLIISFYNTSRFAHPGGLLGETLRCVWDLSFECGFESVQNLSFTKWYISDQYIFSRESLGQVWKFNQVRGNIFHVPDNVVATGLRSFQLYPNKFRYTIVKIKGWFIGVTPMSHLIKRVWFILQKDRRSQKSANRFLTCLEPYDDIERFSILSVFDSSNIKLGASEYSGDILSILFYHYLRRQWNSNCCNLNIDVILYFGILPDPIPISSLVYQIEPNRTNRIVNIYFISCPNMTNSLINTFWVDDINFDKKQKYVSLEELRVSNKRLSKFLNLYSIWTNSASVYSRLVIAGFPENNLKMYSI